VRDDGFTIHVDLIMCRWQYAVGSAGIRPETCQREAQTYWPPLKNGRRIDRGGLCIEHRVERDRERARRGW
jgi:hypothetical protein